MRILILTSLLIAQLVSPCVAAFQGDSSQEIKALDQRILLELIELARFNVQYEREVTHYPRWRKVAYPLGQEGCYAGFLGYSIADMHEHVETWHKPSPASKTVLRGGLTSAIVGSLLGGGSSSIELLSNGGATWRIARKGFASEHAISVVHASIQRIDEMLASRDELMRKSTAGGRYRELLELKGELCKYERDRLIFEFKRWNSQSRGYAWYKNSFYVLNVTANWLRFAAIQAGFSALQKRTYLGAVGPTLLTSSIIASAAPALSTAVGKAVKRHQERHLAQVLSAKPFVSDEEAKQQFTRLSELLANAAEHEDYESNMLRSELALLRKNRVGLDNMINQEERNIVKLSRVAAQQSITAPIVGMVTAGSGIIGTVNYYGYRLQPKTGNKVGFSGDCGTLTAEGIALAATPLAAIVAYRYERALKRRGEHPDQLLSNRMKDIDALEAIIKER